MTGLLEGRSAIVTGAGRGIGRAIAEALVAEGARVIVADNVASIAGDGGDPEVARETAKALGKNALAFSDSVASPGVAKHLVELAVKTFGGIDIVVNNAAILRDAFVFRADPRDWDAVINNNLSEQMRKVLKTLTWREEKVLRMRFGIGEKSDHTLEEVGQGFEVTRERIRQIEAKALRKLRHPSRSKQLKSFIET